MIDRYRVVNAKLLTTLYPARELLTYHPAPQYYCRNAIDSHRIAMCQVCTYTK